MSIFIDSSFFVAIIASQDINHLSALTLANTHLSKRLFSNPLVKYETYNVLCRRYNPEAANIFLAWLNKSSVFMIDITDSIWQKSIALLKKSYTKSGPNVFDYIHFACMLEYGLQNVLTFDRHFASTGFNILK